MRLIGRRTEEVALGSAIRWDGVVVLAGIFIWSYWPTLQGLRSTWANDGDYSSGVVVPLIVAYFVWSRRKALAVVPVRACWWGLAILLIAQLLRFTGMLYAYASLEHGSLFLSVVGAVLLICGPACVWRVKWILLFLVLMFPLPHRIHEGLILPLQGWATSSALFGLELLGVLVVREGNVLRLGDQTSIAVAEACSGLRMLTAFVLVSAALAFVVHRPVWQKILLVLFSFPVAILSNTLRLIATALLYRAAYGPAANTFFHDFAGITMVPIAVAASVGLLALMKWLCAETPAGSAA